MNGVAASTWPPHFPPTDPREKFFCGVRRPSLDLSFFKESRQSQASRTQEAMTTWPDEKQRDVALVFGENIRRRAGWQTPCFIPDDKAAVIANGPRFLEFEEPPLEMAIPGFEDQIGRKFDGGFWRKVIDWSDKNPTFGELIRGVTDQLKETRP